MTDDMLESIEVDDSRIISNEEINDPVHGDICAPVTEDILKNLGYTGKQIKEIELKSLRKDRLIFLANTRDKRVLALSYLASKADEDANRDTLGDMYSELVSTNAMQTIINRWKDTGNSKLAIKSLNKIKGSAKEALDTVVGEKGRTINDYLSYTMAEATNDLDWLLKKR